MVQTYTIIGMRDYTDFIPPDSEDNGTGNGGGIQGSASLSDPNSTWDFSLDDPNQLIPLKNFMPVIVFDENSPKIGSVPTIPSMNFALNPLLTYSPGNPPPNWTVAGALSSSLWSYPSVLPLLTFSNTSITGTTFQEQTTLLGYVQPGVQYMLSLFVHGISPVNIDYFLQINWLDINQTLLSSTTMTPVSPPTTQAQISITGIAPANTAYAQIQFGGQTSNATNSGQITFASVQFEPMWFVSKGVSYPTPDCNFSQVNSVLMPDGTTSRKCRRFAGYIEDRVVSYVGKQRHYAVQCASSSKLLETIGLFSLSAVNTQDTSIIASVLASIPANASIIGQLTTGQQNLFAPTSTLIPGVIVPSASWNMATLRQFLNDVGSQSGSLYYVDAYYYLWYVPPSFAGMTILLSDTPDNVTSFPYAAFTIEYDSTNPANTVVVKGTKQAAAAIPDTFSGNGSTTVFNLTEPPLNVQAVTVGGTAIRTGVDGIDNAKFGPSLTFKALINKQNQTIQFATAPASGSNNVVVTYTYEDQVISQVIAADAVAEQKCQFWAGVNDSAITSTTAAKNRGIAELDAYAFERVILNIDLEGIYLPPGALILFTNQSEGLVAAPFVVQTVQSDLKGGGVDNWQYTAGVYNPTIIDHLRNATKAIQKTPTTANVAVIASIDVAIFDAIHLNDTIVINHNGAPSAGPYLYGPTTGAATYGFGSYA